MNRLCHPVLICNVRYMHKNEKKIMIKKLMPDLNQDDKVTCFFVMTWPVLFIENYPKVNGI